jgi:hypothetical protein
MKNTTTQTDEALKLFRQIRDCMNKERLNLSIGDLTEIGKIIGVDVQRLLRQRSKHANRLVQEQ